MNMDVSSFLELIHRVNQLLDDEFAFAAPVDNGTCILTIANLEERIQLSAESAKLIIPFSLIHQTYASTYEASFDYADFDSLDELVDKMRQEIERAYDSWNAAIALIEDSAVRERFNRQLVELTRAVLGRDETEVTGSKHHQIGYVLNLDDISFHIMPDVVHGGAVRVFATNPDPHSWRRRDQHVHTHRFKMTDELEASIRADVRSILSMEGAPL